MSDEINFEGKEYISSKRASELSEYSQDYIGQLARSGQIEARRIGNLWYIGIESLRSYKTKSEQYKPTPPEHSENAYKDLESLVNFDGRDYISAIRASKI